MALTKYKIGDLITTVDERNTIGIRDFYGTCSLPCFLLIINQVLGCP